MPDQNGVLTMGEKKAFKEKLNEIYNGINIEQNPYLGYLLLGLPESVIDTTAATRTDEEKKAQTYFKENAKNRAGLQVARPKGMYFGYGFEFDANDQGSKENIILKNDQIYIKIQKKMPGSSAKFNKGDYVCIGNVGDIKEVLGIEEH